MSRKYRPNQGFIMIVATALILLIGCATPPSIEVGQKPVEKGQDGYYGQSCAKLVSSKIDESEANIASGEGNVDQFESALGTINATLGTDQLIQGQAIEGGLYLGLTTITGWTAADCMPTVLGADADRNPAALRRDYEILAESPERRVVFERDYSGNLAEQIAYWVVQGGSFPSYGDQIGRGYETAHIASANRLTFTEAATDPQMIATLGAKGRQIILGLDKLPGMHARLIAAVSDFFSWSFYDGDDKRYEWVLDNVKASAKYSQTWNEYDDALVYREIKCDTEIAQHADDENYECKVPRVKVPEMLVDELDGSAVPYYGRADVQSVMVRRYLQAEAKSRGTGAFVVWSYRVWAVVAAHDLGMTDAHRWANQVLNEADQVSGFGKDQYVGFLRTVVAEITDKQVTQDELGTALAPIVKPAAKQASQQ